MDIFRRPSDDGPPYVHNYRDLLLGNSLANQSQSLCEASIGWENNVYINNPGHMTKMATMPIYGKTPIKIFYSKTGGPISTKLGIKY